ncbi:MAG: cation:proton antiporter [bacterium]
MDHSILDTVLSLLILSVGAVAIFRLFNLPPILGYLLVGAITGEYALGWLHHDHTLELMGEIGVVFLLFAIGLEFSVKQLIAMRTTVLGLGGLQVILSTAAAASILHYFGMSWEGAVVAGGAAALSSTAIVVKQLTEQSELNLSHGRMALGILLFQDIAVVPFLVIIPLLANDGGAEVQQNSDFWIAFLKGAGIFISMILIGHFALRRIFHFIASTKSEELFNITVLLIALMAAWVTESVGLSLALGAFIAGIMLNGSEYRHQIEIEIRPYRDILMGIFFITVGTRLDIGTIPDIWLNVLLLVLGLTVGKAILIAALARLFEGDNGIALRTGLVLSQGGEFGFALLALALSDNLMTSEESQAILTAIVISMAIAPIMIKYNGRITRFFVKKDTALKERYQKAHDFSVAVKEVKDHVIICGYRQIGQNLARFLREQGIDYIALELDPKIIKEAWEAGDKIYYGDATHAEILIAAGLYRARLLVVTTADMETNEKIIKTARKKQKDIQILVRTRSDDHLDKFTELGATHVIPENLETTMSFVQMSLESLDVDSNEVIRVTERVRQNKYESLRNYFQGENPRKNTDQGSKSSNTLFTFILQEGDYATQNAINDLYLARFNAKIKGLRRGRFYGDNPSSDTRLKAGDALIINAPADKHADIENYLRYFNKA